MKFSWHIPRRHSDKPDPEAAEADLQRIKAQRPEVEALVESLIREKQLNNFTANVVVTFRGGRS